MNWLSAMAVLAVVMTAQGVHAQASQNPYSDYAACHGGSPPVWCPATCGNPDVWCEFAGFRCYMDNPYFDMVAGVKNHELLSETYRLEADGWSSDYWASDADASEMEDYMLHLATLECVAATSIPYQQCYDGLVMFATPPNCSTGANGWEDWHCEVAQSSTVCLERGT